MQTILIAGGGSGGHITPGLALAEQCLAHHVHPILLHAPRSIDREVLASEAFDTYAVPASPPSLNPKRALRWVMGYVQSRRALRQLAKTHAVAGVITIGGFTAATVGLVAREAGWPLAVLNLDAVPGRANRFLCRWGTKNFTAHAHDQFPGELTAHPIRSAATVEGNKSDNRAALGLGTDRPTLLVTGASNGASTLNALVLNLARNRPEAFVGWQILHLAGSAHHAKVQETWDQTPLADCPVTVLPFLRQMSQAFGASDLVISRAGANSVAEIEAAGLPALYLPYPWHKDQHQRFNAESAAKVKAAIIANDQIEEQANLEQIGPILSDLLTNRQQLIEMTNAAQARQCPNGTSELTRKILDAFGIVPTREGSA
ncbi:MAG: hypothetical protein CMJ37_05335 [Phycisphaerae bacterium]|nr:hypothetical protein [Phycisphaerae bacterium]